MARTVQALGEGGQRLAERELGWNRGTIRKGMHEVKRGIACEDAFSLRGRKRCVDHLPNLLSDITAIADSQSQADLFISGWWIEIEQGFNITAHPGFLFTCALQWNVFFSCDDTDYNSYFGQFIYVIEICLCSLATLRWSSG